VQLQNLWLTNFRSHADISLPLSDGLTVICGPNGIGKTNLLEAISLLSTMKSFRGANSEAMIRLGHDSAVVRADGIRDDREILIELELSKGRTRAQVNRQRLRRSKDLLGALRTTVFAPDDLALIKAGPGLRRTYLDQILVSLDPAFDSVLSDLERSLKHRNALLRQAHGRLDESGALTLDVWDERFGAVGQQVVDRREALADTLIPQVSRAYEQLASQTVPLALEYRRSWPVGTLADALTANRAADVQRGVTQAGPHRDDLDVLLDLMPARATASQGEQRTLALALRLAAHQLVTDRLGEPPLLLLDDVLSELDPDRAHALLTNLPAGQAVITTATLGPEADQADQVLLFDKEANVAPRGMS